MVTKQFLVHSLQQIVGKDGVVWRDEDLLVYECDAYTLEKSTPEAVVFPRTTAEVAAVVRFLHEHRVPFVPRGAGTGLTGAGLPVEPAVMIALTRMRDILEVDYRNRRAVVQAGVVNSHVTRACQSPPQSWGARGAGLAYAPDPSSQPACTIGGNVATNSGGAHTLKYGVTTNHVLGLEVVLSDGTVVHLGSRAEDSPGYDLTGLFVGSEGMLGLATEVILRLIRQPQAYQTILGIFDSLDDASETVSDIIAQGIIPAALEMMDNFAIRAVENAVHVGFPLDAEAILLVEVDGLEAGLAEQAQQIEAAYRAHHAREVRRAANDAERARLWKGRKGAFGAMGRLSPSYCTQDGVVPRSKLPEMLRRIAAIRQKYDVRIANVFHAGDGNVHPLLLFDERVPEEVERVLAASDEILQACVDLGGTITGEHGIGLEKIHHMPLLFSPEDLLAMTQLRAAFCPDGLCNPHKVFPEEHQRVEVRVPNRRATG
jgi:glycolate oxidase